jgi:hypothetical protein
MNCNVIKDLIPLYIDGCCSEESATAVLEHIQECPSCKKLLEEMKLPVATEQPSSAPKVFRRINDWKASVTQSVLLFLSFLLITVGVALEANSGVGDTNGFWAFNLVIPSTGFLLSLTNWYFVRLYKSRKIFSRCCLFATMGFTLCAFVWGCFHYEINLFELFAGASLVGILSFVLFFFKIGIVLTALFCIFSAAFSDEYAKLLGKE